MAKLTISRKIKLNMSASEWQLYSDKEGVDAVAEKINRGVEEAVNSSKTRREASIKIHAVLAEHSKFGAYDSEPCGVAEDLLDKIFGES